MIKLLHVSDTHEANNSGIDFSTLALSAGVDVSIHTGDVCRVSYENSSDYWNFNNSLFVVGNHDTLITKGNNPSGWDWNIRATQEQVYSRFFAPYLDKTGITINHNETWWYKDVNGFRIVGIDQTVNPEYVAAEREWLNATFEDALAKDLTCICASHISNENATKDDIINSVFIAQNYKAAYGDALGSFYQFLTEPYDIAESWVSRGLKIAFWITGHWHSDIMFGKNTFPVIAIGSTINDGWNDTVRNDSIVGRICVNEYDYDERTNLLAIYRLGANNCHNGNSRKMCVLNCSTKQVLTECSRI